MKQVFLQIKGLFIGSVVIVLAKEAVSTSGPEQQHPAVSTVLEDLVNLWPIATASKGAGFAVVLVPDKPADRDHAIAPGCLESSSRETSLNEIPTLDC